jgi:hypothetical protein
LVEFIPNGSARHLATLSEVHDQVRQKAARDSAALVISIHHQNSLCVIPRECNRDVEAGCCFSYAAFFADKPDYCRHITQG